MGLFRRRWTGGVAAVMVAATLAAWTAGAADAAVGDGVLALRGALSGYLAGLPEPATAAERKLVARLGKAVEFLDADPTAIEDEARVVAAGYRRVPAEVLSDPEVAGIVDALLAAMGPDVEAAIDAAAGVVAGLAPGGSPETDVILATLTKARAKLAPALDGATPDPDRFRALDGAAKKLAAASAKIDAYRDALSDCGPIRTADADQANTAALSTDGGAAAALSQSTGSSGTGSDTFGSFGATIVSGGDFFSFSTRNVAMSPGPIDHVTEFFADGAFVRFQRGGVTFQADAGNLTIDSITIRRYKRPGSGTPRNYLEVRGSATGSGFRLDNPAERATFSAEFVCCEIPYALR